MEHRWGHRYAFPAPAQVTAPNGLQWPAVLRDVSMTGAFLATSASLDLLVPVQLSIFVEGYSLRLHGVVARQDLDGVGIEWRDGETVELDLLMQMALKKRLPAAPLSHDRTGHSGVRP